MYSIKQTNIFSQSYRRKTKSEPPYFCIYSREKMIYNNIFMNTRRQLVINKTYLFTPTFLSITPLHVLHFHRSPSTQLPLSNLIAPHYLYKSPCTISNQISVNNNNNNNRISIPNPFDHFNSPQFHPALRPMSFAFCFIFASESVDCFTCSSRLLRASRSTSHGRAFRFPLPCCIVPLFVLARLSRLLSTRPRAPRPFCSLRFPTIDIPFFSQPRFTRLFSSARLRAHAPRPISGTHNSGER